MTCIQCQQRVVMYAPKPTDPDRVRCSMSRVLKAAGGRKFFCSMKCAALFGIACAKEMA